MRKLLILVVCLILMSGCSKNEEINNPVDGKDIVDEIPVSTESDIVVTEKEEIPKRIYEDFGCFMNEEEFYYCWADEKDEDGHIVVYHEGYPIEKKVFDNGFVMYYDEEHPELGYTALHASGGFAILYNDYTVTTYTTDNYDEYTIFFDRQTGEVITIIKGVYVFLEVDEMISTMWFAVTDYQNFKLMSGDSLEWYDEYYVKIPEGPALQYSYPLGNGMYFEAYKEIDGERVNYILDINGSVLLEDSTVEMCVGKNKEYIIKIDGNKYGLTKLDGELVLPIEYDAIETYEDGIVATKDNRLYVYSNLLTPLINGEYELANIEYTRHLCCGNFNNFTAYDSEEGLIVMTIDTDYMYGKRDDSTLEVNPNYTHKFLVKGETVTELEYDFEY
ncbi:MAG: hypothetical protein IKM20_02280 [Erysipelotrichales bacterium]|nr:hypothetical protein [Erysipelotrichales bacterium]